jgi:hypothetical protein
MTNAAAATTQSVPTTTVRGARDDCRFATRDRLVPDAEGFDAVVRSWRRDDFTRSTNVRNVVRRAARFLFPLFEGTTHSSSRLPTEAHRAKCGLAIGPSESKGIARLAVVCRVRNRLGTLGLGGCKLTQPSVSGNETPTSVIRTTKTAKDAKDAKKNREVLLQRDVGCVCSDGSGGAGSPGRESCTALMSPPSAWSRTWQ